MAVTWCALVRLTVTVHVLGVLLMVTSSKRKTVVSWGLHEMMTVPATLCIDEWSEGTW